MVTILAQLRILAIASIRCLVIVDSPSLWDNIRVARQEEAEAPITRHITG